jgi:hypothetical protein
MNLASFCQNLPYNPWSYPVSYATYVTPMDASGLHLIRVSSIWRQRILNAMLKALTQARTQRNTLDSVFRGKFCLLSDRALDLVTFL